MSLPSLLTFIPPILIGTLIVHLLWPDRKSPLDLILQLSLGIGLGLGFSSLLYYVYLNLFAGNPYFLYVEIIFLFAVATAAYLKHTKTTYVTFQRPKLSFIQITVLAIALLVTVVSFLGLVNYSRQRAYGDWDAWMIYNRSALFIHRGGEAWQDAFSPGMDLIFHADYPPLLALNIAARWEALNSETTFAPMVLGFLFTLSVLGLCFGALANFKSPGQGSLGLIFLSGVSFFLSEGGRQTADVPLAFFMLASVVFLFFYYREKRVIFMTFAAVMAALAAWTKNEGLLFVFTSAGVLFLTALWKRSFRGPLFYFAGLLLPLILLFHFKTQVAPPSEFAGGGIDVLFQKLIDPARHQLIFNAFKSFFLYSGGWFGIGIYLILVGYYLLFQTRVGENSHAVLISLAILTVQFIGYYLFYLISPYDLNWHIGYSLNRLFVHAYPATVFVILTATRTPEVVFSPETK
ncbi:hypothetical protein ANAEL_00074 [Anaerolineales bacterium]|nr:hypothetical protein ANAEL_00074 [Anaerolineales bacterium]